MIATVSEESGGMRKWREMLEVGNGSFENFLKSIRPQNTVEVEQTYMNSGGAHSS